MKRKICVMLLLSLLIACVSALVITAGAESTPTNVKGTYGLTFDANNPLTISGDVEVEPNTLSATVYLPKSYTARAGAVFGNYSGAAGRTYTLEVNTNGQPRLFIQATNSTAVNLVFNQLDVRGDEPRRVSIVMDKTSKSATCYVSDLSGNLIGKQTMTSTVAYPTFTVDKLYMIGGDYRSGNGQYFKGEVIEVAMYADQRTEAECLAGTVNTYDEDMIFGFDLTKSAPEYGRDLSGNGHHVVGTVTEDTVIKEGMTFTVDTPLTVTGDIKEQPNTVSATIRLSKSDFENADGTYNANVRPGVIISNYQSTNDAYDVEIHNGGGRPRLYVRSNDHKYTVDFLFSTTIYKILSGTDTDAANAGTPIDAPITISIVVDQTARESGARAKATLYVYDVNGNLLKTEVKETSKTSSATTYPALPTDAEYTPSKTIYMIGGDYRPNNAQWFIGEILEVAMYTGYRTAAECKTVIDTADKSMICGFDLTAGAPDFKNDLSGNNHTLLGVGEELPDPNWLPTNPNAPTDYAYSMAIVGDTQQLTKYDVLNGTSYTADIYNWLVANAAKKNMKLVMGLGDITNDDTDAEWVLAMEQIAKLNGVVPYTLNRGNPPHDSTAKFNQYVGASSEYIAQLDGLMTEGAYENAYKELVIGETKYLVMMLDWAPTDAALTWAGRVIEKHPNHRVIITTHGYLYADGEPYDHTDHAIAHGQGFSVKNNGDEIWNELVKLYPNIMMVISGHDPSDNIITAQVEGIHGNRITQMLVDPQGMDPNYSYATGMVAMLYFSEDGERVSVEYISTVRANQGKDAYFKVENQFNLDLFADVNPPAPPATDFDDFNTPYGTIPSNYDVATYPFAVFVPDATSPTGYRFSKAAKSLLTDSSVGVTATGSAFNFLRPDQNKEATDGSVILMRRDFIYNNTAEVYSNLTYNVAVFTLDLGGHIFTDKNPSGSIFYWYLKGTNNFLFTVKNGGFEIGYHPLTNHLGATSSKLTAPTTITTVYKNVNFSFIEGATATSVFGAMYNAHQPSGAEHTFNVSMIDCTVDYANSPAGVDLLADGSSTRANLFTNGCTFKNRGNVPPKMNITMSSDFILNVYIPLVTTDENDTVSGIKLGGAVYSLDGVPVVDIDGARFYKVSMAITPETLGTILSLSVDVEHIYTFSNETTAKKTVNSSFSVDIIAYLTELSNDPDVNVANLGKDILSYVRAAYVYAGGDASVIAKIDSIIGADYDKTAKPSNMEKKEITDGMASASLRLGEKPAFIFYPELDKEGNPVYSLENYQFALDGKYRLNAEIRTDENGKQYFYISTYAYAMLGTVEYLVSGTDIHGYYNIRAYYDFTIEYGDANLTALVERLWKYTESAAAYRESR